MGILLSIIASGWAAPPALYDVTFCAEYNASYSDANPSFGDDFLTEDTVYPARGVRMEVVRNSDSLVV